MDISSIMMTSASRGFSSFLSKCIPMLWAPFPDLGAPGITGASLPGIPTGTSSSMRWMVLASYPVASVIRLAARPVGAARSISIPSISKYRMIVLMVVVLPVPGPPVITNSPLFTASYTAFSCSSSRCMDSCCCIFRRLALISAWGMSPLMFRSCSIRAALSSR